MTPALGLAPQIVHSDWMGYSLLPQAVTAMGQVERLKFVQVGDWMILTARNFMHSRDYPLLHHC